MDRLRKLTPIQAGIVMLFVTFIIPFIVTISGSWGTRGVNLRGINIVATLWGIGPVGSPDSQFHIFHPLEMIPGLFLSFPNIAFSGQIIRYLKGKTTYRRTIMLGILGFLFPFTFTLNIMVSLLQYGYFVYSGSLPFQIMMGIVLMKYPGPPTEAVWDSEKEREDWWSEELQS